MSEAELVFYSEQLSLKIRNLTFLLSPCSCKQMHKSSVQMTILRNVGVKQTRVMSSGSKGSSVQLEGEVKSSHTGEALVRR